MKQPVVTLANLTKLPSLKNENLPELLSDVLFKNDFSEQVYCS